MLAKLYYCQNHIAAWFWNFAKFTSRNVEYLSEMKTGMCTKSIHHTDWFARGVVGYFDEAGVRGGAVDCFDEAGVRGGAVDCFDEPVYSPAPDSSQFPAR